MAARTGEEIRVGDMAIRFLVEGEQSAGSVALFEFDVPAGAKVAAAHSHDGYEETIYGLDGTLTWTIEGAPSEVGPGEALFIPRGAVHHFDEVPLLTQDKSLRLREGEIHRDQNKRAAHVHAPQMQMGFVKFSQPERGKLA